MKNIEPVGLEAVHTHTHTHTSILLENKINKVNRIEKIEKIVIKPKK